MKKSFILMLAAVSLHAGLSGCRVENIDPPQPLPVTPVVILTSAKGADAASVVLRAKELAITSTNMFRDLGFIAQTQMASGVTTTGSGACADYGTFDYSSVYDSGSGNYTVTNTLNLCRQNGFQYEGQYSASGKADNFTGSMSGLKILNFTNNYKTLIGSLVGGNLSYIMKGSGIPSNAAYTFIANGGMQAFDYYSLGQHSMNFTKLITNYYVSTDSATNVRTSTLVLNGAYSVNLANSTSSMTYTDYNVDILKQLSSDIEDVSITGRIALNSNSAIKGAFDVVTTTPVRAVSLPFPPKTTQGTFTINNIATVQYGASNTISVSVAGDTPMDYAKEFFLMKRSSFYAMVQQIPVVSGPTGTAFGTVMSISALSTAPTTTDLNCFTDVHVNYYTETNPAASNGILWYVDWHKGLSTCKPQSGVPFQEATSSTGAATDFCDVGLDINGASQDITSGGVEHFLAATLPVGYYVLSIDNYSCATTVHNAATVLVGDYLFGPYDCSYSGSDGEYGQQPDSWCRLVDVRVNGDGTIDVLPPNAVLQPWHP